MQLVVPSPEKLATVPSLVICIAVSSDRYLLTMVGEFCRNMTSTEDVCLGTACF